MDCHKICFIICTNNKQYMNEAIYYIQRLYVPEDYQIDILTVEEAISMASGYNEGMNVSDAKYKIYLHQDVFIIDRNFLYRILKLFEDKSIGMIGMVGVPHMPENGVMFFGDEVGKLYSARVGDFEESTLGVIEGEYCEVDAIDGMLMATQYDITWRDDLFCGWDFYDASQSFEFRKKGYKVIVPRQEKPWCIHDADFINMTNYYRDRRVFVDTYLSE